MLRLFWHELRARRGAMIGWGLGLAIFGAYIVTLYPQVGSLFSQLDFSDIELYQVFGDFGDLGTFKGFVNAELFSMLPLVVSIYALINGTGTLAGEEDSGTLEILLALPVRRWQLVLAKFIALGLALLIILAALGGGVVLAFNSLPADADTGGLTAGRLFVALLGVWPLVMLFAALSLFLGAYLPSRRWAATVATLTLIVSYFGNNLAAFSEALESIQPIFPFYYFDGTKLLDSGWDRADTTVLLGAVVGLLALALISFQRRNVTVAAWPWQRPRSQPQPRPARA